MPTHPPLLLLAVSLIVSHGPTERGVRQFVHSQSPGRYVCCPVGPEYWGPDGYGECSGCLTSSWWCGCLNYRCPAGWDGNGPWAGWCESCEAKGRGERWENVGDVMRGR